MVEEAIPDLARNRLNWKKLPCALARLLLKQLPLSFRLTKPAEKHH